MSEEHHEEVVGHIVVGSYSLFFLSEVVGEGGLKVGGARGKDNLMAVDWLAFDHQSDIAELRLVQDG